VWPKAEKEGSYNYQRKREVEAGAVHGEVEYCYVVLLLGGPRIW
jgi:hypothetical protein